MHIGAQDTTERPVAKGIPILFDNTKKSVVGSLRDLLLPLDTDEFEEAIREVAENTSNLVYQVRLLDS